MPTALELAAALPKYQESSGTVATGLKAGGLGALEMLSHALAATTDSERAAQAAKNLAASREEVYAAYGGPKALSDVKGVGDFVNWLLLKAAESVPYMLPAVVTGGVGGAAGAAAARAALASGAATGVPVRELAKNLALSQAREKGAAALTREALQKEIIRQAAVSGARKGAFVGGSGIGFGDVLQSQAEESGEYNVPIAAALSPLYGALGMLGAETAILKAAGREGAKELAKDVTKTATREGLMGRAGRALAEGAKIGAMGGIGETGQEVVNQLGRMAVNPEAGLLSGDAPTRYLESLVAGTFLEAAPGAVKGALTKPILQTKEDIATRADQIAMDVHAIETGGMLQAEREAQVKKAADEAKAAADKRKARTAELAKAAPTVTPTAALTEAVEAQGPAMTPVPAALLETLANQEALNEARLQAEIDEAVQLGVVDPVQYINAGRETPLTQEQALRARAAYDAGQSFAQPEPVAGELPMPSLDPYEALQAQKERFAKAADAVLDAQAAGVDPEQVRQLGIARNLESAKLVAMEQQLAAQQAEADVGGLFGQENLMREAENQLLADWEQQYAREAEVKAAQAKEQEAQAKAQAEVQLMQAKEQELVAIQDRIAEGRRKETREKRLRLFAQTMGNLKGGENPNRAWDRALRAAGFNDTNFTREEQGMLATISKRPMRGDVVEAMLRRAYEGAALDPVDYTNQLLREGRKPELTAQEVEQVRDAFSVMNAPVQRGTEVEAPVETAGSAMRGEQLALDFDQAVTPEPTQKTEARDGLQEETPAQEVTPQPAPQPAAETPKRRGRPKKNAEPAAPARDIKAEAEALWEGNRRPGDPTWEELLETDEPIAQQWEFAVEDNVANTPRYDALANLARSNRRAVAANVRAAKNAAAATVDDTVGEAADENTVDTPFGPATRLYSQNLQSSDSQPFITALGETPTVQEVLNYAANNGNAIQRNLARLLQRLGVTDVALKVEDSVLMEKDADGKDVQTNAYYDSDTNTVVLHAGGRNLADALHELTHSVTMKRLAESADLLRKLAKKEVVFDKLTVEQREMVQAYADLNDLRNQVAKLYPNEYATTNVTEFVAEVFANPDLQTKLAYMEVPQPMGPVGRVGQLIRSGWQKFIKAVSELLGGSKMDNTILAHALSRAGVFFDLNQGALNMGKLNSRVGADAVSDMTQFMRGRLFEDPKDAPKNLLHTIKRPGEVKRVLKLTGEKLLHGINHFRTMRGLASANRGFAWLVDTASRMTRRKTTVLSALNEFMRQHNTLNEEGRISVSDMLYAGTLRDVKDIEKTVEKLVRDHESGARPMYTEAEDGSIVPAKHVVEMNQLTLAEINAGVKLPNEDRSVQKDWTEESPEYKAYVGDRMAMLVGFLERLRSSERQMRMSLDTSREILFATRSQDERSAINTLETLYENGARKVANALARGKKGDAERVLEKKLQTAKRVLHGLITGDTPKKGQEMADTLQILGKTEAELQAIVKPLNDSHAIAKKGSDRAARDYVDQIKSIVAGAMELGRTREAAARYAATSIAKQYMTLPRSGRYVLQAVMLDAQGNQIGAHSADIADYWKDSKGEKIQLLSTLPLIRTDDELEAQSVYDDLVAQGYDGKEVEYYNKDGVVEKGTLKVLPVAEAANERSARPGVSPLDFMAMADAAGVSLSMPERENIIKMATRAEDGMRRNLMRKGRPGYEPDATTGMADFLNDIASLVAISEYKPVIEATLASRALWSTPTEQEIAAAQAKVDTAPNEAAKIIAQQQLSELQKFKKAGKALRGNTPEYLKGKAVDYVGFILKDGFYSDVQNDALTNLRSVATVAQLGMSFATAFTNLTSFVTHTLPTLATYNETNGFGGGFGYAKSQAALMKSAKAFAPVLRDSAAQMLPGKEVYYAEDFFRKQIEQAEAGMAKTGKDPMVGGYSLDAWKFALGGMNDGTLESQRFNELLALRSQAGFMNKRGKFIAKYMAPFSASEEYLRMATAMAAYELQAERNREAGVSVEPGVVDTSARDMAYKLLYNAQGEYNAANRPILMRDGVGALVFMYKTYISTTLELLKNLPPEGRAVMLGATYMMAGAMGMPGWEELMAVLDGLVQSTGWGDGLTKGSAERALANWLRAAGKDLGIEKLDHYLMRGIIDTALGTTVLGRSGMEIGVPMVGMLREGSDFWNELGRAIGPAGGVIEGTIKSAGSIDNAMLDGQWNQFFRNAPLTFVRNLADAYSYAKYDAITNKRGQVTSYDVNAVDMAARVLGFYPAEVGEYGDTVRRSNYVRDYGKAVSTGFTEAYSYAGIAGDRERMMEIRQSVQEWNQTFRGTELEIKDFASKAQRRLEDAKLTLLGRTQKSLPTAMQAAAEEEFEE